MSSEEFHDIDEDYEVLLIYLKDQVFNVLREKTKSPEQMYIGLSSISTTLLTAAASMLPEIEQRVLFLMAVNQRILETLDEHKAQINESN